MARKKTDRWPQLYRLLNFINAKYWPFNDDWAGGNLYSASCLVTPRFCLTEDDDECDLMAIMAVSYDLFKLVPLKVCDYITATMPARINEDLSFPPDICFAQHHERREDHFDDWVQRALASRNHETEERPATLPLFGFLFRVLNHRKPGLCFPDKSFARCAH